MPSTVPDFRAVVLRLGRDGWPRPLALTLAAAVQLSLLAALQLGPRQLAPPVDLPRSIAVIFEAPKPPPAEPAESPATAPSAVQPAIRPLPRPEAPPVALPLQKMPPATDSQPAGDTVTVRPEAAFDAETRRRILDNLGKRFCIRRPPAKGGKAPADCPPPGVAGLDGGVDRSRLEAYPGARFGKAFSGMSLDEVGLFMGWKKPEMALRGKAPDSAEAATRNDFGDRVFGPLPLPKN